MGERLIQVDAFTDRAFAGNPAAVCLLDKTRDEEWMQNVAREMNLSETAFLTQRDDGDWDLRWFTPTIEVDLCGHATLASAHVLFDDGVDAPIRFYTRSGVLSATKDGDWIELDFPARRAEIGAVPEALIVASGAWPAITATGEIGGGLVGYLLELPTEEDVRALQPDVRALEQIPNGYLVVTARASTDGFDFVSRFFAPLAGVDEDPVTGSSHCTLGPWWAERLGKDVLLGYQASARGGTVRVRPVGDRVYLGGKAVTVLRGELA